MNITTINDKRNMTYEYYIKQPMHAVEIRLNVIVAKNPHLIYSPNRYINPPLSRKNSQMPFKI